MAGNSEEERNLSYTSSQGSNKVTSCHTGKCGKKKAALLLLSWHLERLNEVTTD
jgi:hypothetical protein